MTQRLSRQEAKAVGASRCFGSVCQKHPEWEGERYVSGACVECARAQLQESRRRNPERVKAHAKKSGARIKQDPAAAARKKQRDARYAKEHAEKGLEYVKARRRKNPEVFREYVKKCKQKNPAPVRANTAKRRAARMLRTPAWLTADDHWIMQEAYALAALRSKLFGFSWHVDHIVPLQGETVSGLHVPNNLQVIPGRENMSKANKYETLTSRQFRQPVQ